MARGSQTETNCQVLPGDRIFNCGDHRPAWDNTLAYLRAAIQCGYDIAASLLALSDPSVRETMHPEYNRTRSGF